MVYLVRFVCNNHLAAGMVSMEEEIDGDAE